MIGDLAIAVAAFVFGAALGAAGVFGILAAGRGLARLRRR